MSDENLEETKKRLEIEKLRLDIKFINRPYIGQITNTIVIFLLGFIVFYFYQRPQINILDAVRQEDERKHVAEFLLNAQKIDNKKERLAAMSVAEKTWSNYSFVHDIRESEAAGDKTDILVGAKDECQTLTANINELKGKIENLEMAAKQELSVGSINERLGRSGGIGRGPVWRAINAQIENNKIYLENLIGLKHKNKCV